MRRKEREITDVNEMEAIISEAEILRVAMSVNNMPYIVPVNFGYKDNVFYFHCAKQGKKLDIIKRNANVAFEIDIDGKLLEGKIACEYTMKYKSIIGEGTARVVTDNEEKKSGLDIIMAQYSNLESFEYNEKALDRVEIVKIEVNTMTGKKSGY